MVAGSRVDSSLLWESISCCPLISIEFDACEIQLVVVSMSLMGFSPIDSPCIHNRGGIFDPTASSTWNASAFYPLGLDPQLGFDGFGQYGYDTVALGDQVAIRNRVVGVVNSTDYLLGFFGLNTIPITLNQTETATVLSSLVAVDLIPSHVYGYSAGAYYRECPGDWSWSRKFTDRNRSGLKHVPASLTLGGYDSNRFEPHDVKFSLGPSRSPMVAVKAIKVKADPIPGANLATGWPDNSFSLLNSADDALYTIDSSTPYLWLPESVCAQFEAALGLTYDDDVQLYTFGNNILQHQNLVNWNLTFNFIISDNVGSSNLVSLSLPYDAFDLQLNYPFPGLNATSSSPPKNYFPLRKAANESQYTLGRSFLQETYLLVDYDRENFSVHQAKFRDDTLLNITNVIMPQNSDNKTSVGGGSGPPTKGGLSKGALVGVAVGASAAVAIVVIGVFWICMRRRNRSPPPATGSEDSNKIEEPKKKSWFAKFSHWLFGTSKVEPLPEIDGASTSRPELIGTPLNELPGPIPFELAGDEPEVPPYVAAQRKNAVVVSPADNSDKKPAELEHRTSTTGFYAPDAESLPSPGLAPPYSANDVGRRNTQTTGISSRSMRTSRDSSQVSSPVIISPITPSHVSPLMPSLAHVARRDQWRQGNDSDRTSFSEQEIGLTDEDPVSPWSHRGDRGDRGDRALLRGSPQRSPRRFSYEDQG